MIVVLCGIKIGEFLAPPKPLEIHLHPDGKLTLGSRDGRVATPSEFEAWRASGMKEAPIILDTPPGTTIDAWQPTLMVLGEMGFGRYQLRLGGQILNCHLPGSCCSGRGDTNIPAKILDLRKRDDAPEPTEQSHYDVQVLVDQSTTWDEVFQQSSIHLHPGVSLMIDKDGAVFLRDRDEDEQYQKARRRTRD